jgi:hypothetical protein
MIKARISTFGAMVVVAAIAFCISSFRLTPVLSPQLVIYKTKKDYSKYVPVTLSTDKSKVVSYPDIKDVYFEGKLAYPTALAHDFWLDNRGVGPNTAFIKLTYEEYSRLPGTPSPDELFAMILDANPFREIYSMGNRHSFKDPVAEINRIIEEHGLKKYKRLK